MDEALVKQRVGAKIKKFRTSQKLTQFKLGELVDINQRQIAMIESGKSFPSLNTLVKLSNVFDCTIADFFDNEIPQDEKFLKDILKKQIDNLDYSNCKRLYFVIKNLLLL